MKHVAGRVRSAGRSAVIRLSRPARGAAAVWYGHRRIPAPGAPVEGGMVKFQRLQTTFPNRPRDVDLLYLGSSSLPSDTETAIELAQRRGAPIVVNQDGVAYPAWAGDETERLNARHRLVLGRPPHVVYQSAFSKESADRFVGVQPQSWEILHNAVDATILAGRLPRRDRR